ncbi:MAG: hypothetical protein O6930_06175 [Gammaproteobacteria bacterium]|nr:hypothetical protein [Gammaproteobacteria bacterium]
MTFAQLGETGAWKFLRLSKNISLLSLVTVLTPTLLVAQPSGVPDLSGNWQFVREFSSCGEWNVDHNGQERHECTAPIDQMPLNARARAWTEFFDEPVSGMWDCAPAPLPSLLAHPTPTNIVQRPDRIMISYEHDDGRRTIWMDGRRHPPASELFYHGHSIGHYEEDVLVIETTNFTFDPDGLDDHGHLPSSPRKRLTERYTRTSPDSLELEITYEDSLFLTEPFTWTRQIRRTEFSVGQWGDCDPEQSRRQLDTLPVSKYPD